MAISKKVISNKTPKTTNTPEPIGTIPSNNPEHESKPIDFHHPHPHIKLYNSFSEAKYACSLIFLKPGEAHTEFYKNNENEYHCVVAIGNIVPTAGHLYLTDSGDQYSIDERLDQMNSSVDWLSKQFINLENNKFKPLQEEVELFEENVNQSLDAIQTDIQNFENQVNSSINSLTNVVNNVVNIVNEFKQQVNNEINDISVYVSSFGDAINQLQDNVHIIDNSINIINNKLNAHDLAIETINSSIVNLNNNIDIIDNRVNSLEDYINRVDSSLQKEINRNNIQDSSINVLDSSIKDLYSKINDFQPIIDSSIYSLFHDDIWTINLCCYTAGGYIKIFDVYNEDRVAECTPHNEYKTYVNGDNAIFNAVTNVGYKFVEWRKDNERYSTNSSINITFNNDDIPVIGTVINDALEPKPLKHGYTAIFKKLYTLNGHCEWSIVGKEDEPQKTEILTYTGDIIDSSNNTKYFDDGAVIYVNLKVDDGHKFTGFVVNDVLINLDDEQMSFNPTTNTYTLVLNNYKENVIIVALIVEYWSTVMADANPDIYGGILMDSREYLLNSNIEIKAIAYDGCEFVKWHSTHPDLMTEAQLIRAIGGRQNLNNPIITLNVYNETIRNYELTGDFRLIELSE